MNIIASLGLKAKNLYKISLQEFLEQNPELKKLNNNIQKERYNLYEEERKNNIEKCIRKRKELINATKKEKKIKNIKIKVSNTESNSISNNILNKKGKSICQDEIRYFMTEDSYMMKNINGEKSIITKEDLGKITCLKNEKNKLEKKAEENEDYLLRILKSELIREKKINQVKDKIEEKDRKIKKFFKKKNENLKQKENERYQDHQDIYERQKLYEKMMSNYNKKVETAKKKNTQNMEKSEELKEKINDYERKNKEFKNKIAKIFDLKEMEKGKENNLKYYVKSNPNSFRGRYIEMKEKFEMERFKRENALMSHINQFQKKINGYLEKREEKEKKIKNTIKEIEKKREEQRLMNSMHYYEIREKIKDKKKKEENERKKK